MMLFIELVQRPFPLILGLIAGAATTVVYVVRRWTPEPVVLAGRVPATCISGNCVAVAAAPHGHVLVGDTKRRYKRPHVFTEEEWLAFIQAVKNGDFELDALPRVARTGALWRNWRRASIPAMNDVRDEAREAA